MKTRFSFIAFGICLIFAAGCLNSGGASIVVDLNSKTGEMKYFNIVSDSKDEKEIKSDFQTLLDMVFKEEDPKPEEIKMTSKKLYRNNDQLDGIIIFSFNDPEKALKELNFGTDENGNYILKLGNDIYVRSNGTYIEKDSEKFVKWNKDITKIELETKTDMTGWQNSVSLLSYWLEWEKNNPPK